MNRREFIKKSAIFCTASSAITPGLLRTIWAQSPEKKNGSGAFPDIAAVVGSAESAVPGAIERIGGISRFVKPGYRILLKANMGFANPASWATTTSPEVVHAVVKLVLDAGAKTVLIGENPNRDPERVIERCGIGKALSEFSKVKVFLIHKPRDFHEVPVPGGQEFTTLSVASILSKVDLLINLPVAKSHQATDVSLGLKNLMGLIQDRRAFHTKCNLHRAIADMNRAIRPGLTILDATRVLVSGGPTGPGKTVQRNMVIAGTDPVAVDTYGVSLERWNGRSLKGEQVSHIAAAHEAGLGEIDLTGLTVVHEKL
jgi:uncharacterized protein (DUF362 family)